MFHYELIYTTDENRSYNPKTEKGYKHIRVDVAYPSADIAFATAKFLLGDYKNKKKVAHMFVHSLTDENGNDLKFIPVKDIPY